MSLGEYFEIQILFWVSIGKPIVPESWPANSLGLKKSFKQTKGRDFEAVE